MASARIRIDFPERRSIGIGKVELLEGVEACGSLAEAARRMHMSYRRAWLLLEDMNKSFAQPVSKASVGGRGGGGVQLTEFGQKLVKAYRELEEVVKPLVEAKFGGVMVSAESTDKPRRGSIKPRAKNR
jgi:molybdate transport system regulatory protein